MRSKADFLEIARPLKGIRETVDYLHKLRIKCILITVGPVQVAKAVSDIYGFYGYYGSNYEVIDGKFTGQISDYIKAENKVNCVMIFAKRTILDLLNVLQLGMVQQTYRFLNVVENQLL